MCSLEFYFELMQFGFYVFKLLSFFFFIFMIVKCYHITYKDSLQEYNVILLYGITWIIWCLTHDYVFFLRFFFSFYFLFITWKMWLLSLSLSLSIYIYIYILFYKFTLGWWIIVFFFYNIILDQYDFLVCLIFKIFRHKSFFSFF